MQTNLGFFIWNKCCHSADHNFICKVFLNGFFSCFCRIVCEMDPATLDIRPGPAQLCVGECRPELMARSSQLYSFVVMITLTARCSLTSHNIKSTTKSLLCMRPTELRKYSMIQNIHVFQLKAIWNFLFMCRGQTRMWGLP